MTAPEVKFNAQRVRIAHLDGLVPGVGNPLKGFRLDGSCSPQLRNFTTLAYLVEQVFGLFLTVAFGCPIRRRLALKLTWGCFGVASNFWGQAGQISFLALLEGRHGRLVSLRNKFALSFIDHMLTLLIA
jgi:hypothetical protein